MGEPIKLINPKGEEVITYSRFEAAELVEGGYMQLGVVRVDSLADVTTGDVSDVAAGIEIDDFTVVEGISEEIQAALENAGVTTWETVAEWGATRLNKEIAGVGAARAKALVAEAERILE